MDYQKPECKDYVELDGKIFKHRKGTTHFYNNDDQSETVGFYKLLKMLSPNTYRSQSMKYKAPQELLLLGASSRIRVMRAVQYHYYKANVTDYTLNTLMPLLLYMSDKSTDCGQFNKVGQQFNACKWAVNNDYSHNDYAAALFNDVGIAPSFSEIKMKGSSGHAIIQGRNEIVIEIADSCQINERFRNGLMMIIKELDRSGRTGESKPVEAILGLAMRDFYFYNDCYLSIHNELRQEVYNAYKDYLLVGKRLGIGNIEMPVFENPVDTLEPQTIILPYDVFIKDGVSNAQLWQRQRNAYNKNYEETLKKVARLPKTINLFTYQQLKDVGLYSRSLQSALRNEIIISIERGMYQFASDFWQEVCSNAPEEMEDE